MTRSRLRFGFALFVGLLVGRARAGAQGPTAPPAALRAGAAAVDASPTQFPVLINGGMTSRSATEVVDPVYARALVLDDGRMRLAICVVDSCLMPRDLLDEAKAMASKATGIPAERMLVSATHTHTAPAAMGVLGTDADPNYPPLLKRRIAEAIERANGNLAPARVAWGVADGTGYTACRRWIRRSDRVNRDPFGELTVRANMHPGFQSPDAIGPSGPVDPDVTVLSVQTADGKPLALLANFAMHYFSGPKPVSADYFGIFAKRVAERLHAGDAAAGRPAFVGIMSQGTSGDMWRTDYSQPAKPTITIDEYADALAKLAVDAVAAAPHLGNVDLAMASKDIRVKARGPTPDRLAWAKKVVAEMGDRLPKTQSEVYAREAIFLSQRPEADMLLQAVRIGDFGMTALPNEVYALTGLKIKALSPLRPTMNVELANDELGYIPPPEQQKLGGYTTWPARSSYTDVDTEPRMVEAVVQLLEQIAGRPRRAIAQGVGPYAKEILGDRPAAYWRLGEMNGPQAIDASGNGRHGAYEGGVVFFLPGPASGAFDGEGTTHRAAHFAGGRMRADMKGLASAYSVEMWFWNGLAPEARPVASYLFARGVDGDKDTGDHLGIGGTDRAPGRLLFSNGKWGTVLTGRTAVAPRTWNHVALVRDGLRATVYLNGDTDAEILLADAVTGFAANVGQLCVGGRNDNVGNFEGKIAEVVVYPRELTGAEVARHYKAAAYTPPATQPVWHPVTAPAAAQAILPTPPKSPTESLAALHVKDGFTVELVAAEPLVRDPVAIAFGPDGKLWVAEMSDYPYGVDGKMKPGSRIRYLEDTDGDGTYNKSTLFMDGVNFCNGVMPWGKGVIVTAAPEIFYAEDTDGDGKADVRRTLYTGFSEGNPQLRVNGPTWGLDNWVHVANGLSSHGKVRSVATGVEVDATGHDFRIRPDDGAIETEAGPSEFGHNRDDWGNYFGCDNSHPMWHCVLPERYLKRNPYVAAPKPLDQMGLPPNPPVYPVSQEGKRYHSFEHARHYTSACGAMVYRDEVLFPRGEQEHAFVCEPVHNLVQHLVLTPAGATFTAKRGEADDEPDFLASADPWFRPVFATTGPDGALWVVDMYRFMIEHPDYLPQQGKDEYRPFFRLGEERGRIYRVYPKGHKPRAIPRLDGLHGGALAGAMNHANGWQRDTAQQLIVSGHDLKAVPDLEAMVLNDDGPPALQALATLDGLGALKPLLIQHAMANRSGGIRRLALRLSESHEMIADAPPLVGDDDPATRLQLACTLGEWDAPAAGAALAKLALSAGDDAYLNAVVMSSALKHYDALAAAALRSPQPAEGPLLRSLLDVAFAANNRAGMATLLAAVMTRTEGGAYSAGQMEAFGHFLDNLALHKSSIAALTRGVDDDLTEQLRAAANLYDAARKVAADGAASADARTAAVALLGREDALTADDLAALAALLTPQTPTPVQRAAVASISHIGGGEDVFALLARGWPAHSPEVRVAIVQAALSREPWSWGLLKAVEAGRIAPTDVDPAGRQRLLRHPSQRVKAEAARLLGTPGDADRQKAIDAFRPALSMTGDAKRGAAVFTKACATCHRLGGIGQEIGPNLRSVSGWSPDMLLANILDPNRQVEPRYLSYTATLTSGEAVFGIVTAETGNGLVIKGIDGKERTLLRSSIQTLAGSGRSLMPDGLESGLEQQDVADLIRFLQAPPVQ